MIRIYHICNPYQQLTHQANLVYNNSNNRNKSFINHQQILDVIDVIKSVILLVIPIQKTISGS